MDDIRRVKLWILVVISIGGAGIWLHSVTPRENDTAGRASQAMVPATELETPFRNVFGGRFSGSTRCEGCHIEEARAFHATPHSHSLERVRPNSEPPDDEFFHSASNRGYKVFRRDDTMWHREFSRDGQGLFGLGEYPITWRIGSGHHSRSYLINVDDHFFESPVTWYSSTNSWGVSPGYDFREHEGFSRAANEGCIQCHAGRVEAVESSTHRLNLIEPSIGCESCHGTGMLHIDERALDISIAGEHDDTIVHPGRLTRELNEAICARCHLRGVGWSNVRGRSTKDFRPGLLMTDFRVDFALQKSTGLMQVVGHFEQMRASRCYTQSDTLTCTTCHNPHASPSAEMKVEYYQRKCLGCHASDDDRCAVPAPVRLAESPADNCVTCHMPESGTEIPHFAFTHHRIGIQHARQCDEQPQSALSGLVPIGDVSRLSSLDLERCTGLAWLRYGDSLDTQARFFAFAEASERLGRVHELGMRDAGVLGGLAYLSWIKRDPLCISFAEQALDASDCTAEIRSSSLIILGDMHFELGDIVAAEAAFDQLTRQRLRYTDWQMLGICRGRLGRFDDAIQAFQAAVDLKPGSAELHVLLAIALDQVGQKKLAEAHRKTSLRLKY